MEVGTAGCSGQRVASLFGARFGFTDLHRLFPARRLCAFPLYTCGTSFGKAFNYAWLMLSDCRFFLDEQSVFRRGWRSPLLLAMQLSLEVPMQLHRIPLAVRSLLYLNIELLIKAEVRDRTYVQIVITLGLIPYIVATVSFPCPSFEKF